MADRGSSNPDPDDPAEGFTFHCGVCGFQETSRSLGRATNQAEKHELSKRDCPEDAWCITDPEGNVVIGDPEAKPDVAINTADSKEVAN